MKTTPERLSVMEEQLAQNSREHKDIAKAVENINLKLDTAIVSKANQSELDSLNNRLWGFATIIITAFVTMIAWFINK